MLVMGCKLYTYGGAASVSRKELNFKSLEKRDLQQDYVVPIERGDCLVHPGKLYHGSYPISKGTRYVNLRVGGFNEWH